MHIELDVKNEPKKDLGLSGFVENVVTRNPASWDPLRLDHQIDLLPGSP